MKPELYIGIDPDCHRSGFALYNPTAKQIERMDCHDLFALIDELRELHKRPICVHLEAGWLKRGTWHRGGNSMAKKVGANHEVGRQIEKYLIRTGIPYRLIIPQGYSACTHDLFCKITGWPREKKTNPETRVAGLLVYGS